MSSRVRYFLLTIQGGNSLCRQTHIEDCGSATYGSSVMHCLNASHYRYYANTCSFLLVLSLVFHVRMGRGEQAPGFAFSINSAQIPGGLSPRAIGTDPNGNVYVSSIWNVIKLDTNGTFIGEWGTQGTGPGQFSYSA